MPCNKTSLKKITEVITNFMVVYIFRTMNTCTDCQNATPFCRMRLELILSDTGKAMYV